MSHVQPLIGSLVAGLDGFVAGRSMGIEVPHPTIRDTYSMRTTHTPGVHAQRLNAGPDDINIAFEPCAKGAAISVAMRVLKGAASPFVFCCLQTPDVTSTAYVLGLARKSPGVTRIVLAKTSPALGPLDEVPLLEGGTVLQRALRDDTEGEWHHLKLEATVNTNGDVVLNCYRNDLRQRYLGQAPQWSEIPGMPVHFFDDPGGVRTGSLPLLSGYVGIGAVLDVDSAAAITGIQVVGQT